MGRALLQHLHHSRGSPDFGFRQKQVNVFRHHDIPDDYEAITLARLFQNRDEGVAAEPGLQKRQSPVARASDKVQVMSAIGPMQAAGHDRPMVQAASYPPLQRTQGRGTQSSGTGKVKGETETRATRPTASEAIRAAAVPWPI